MNGDDGVEKQGLLKVFINGGLDHILEVDSWLGLILYATEISAASTFRCAHDRTYYGIRIHDFSTARSSLEE